MGMDLCQLFHWIPSFNKPKSVLKSELFSNMVQIHFSQKYIEINYSQWRNLSKVYLSIGHRTQHMDEWCWTFIAQQCLVFGEGPHAEDAFCQGRSEIEAFVLYEINWIFRNRNWIGHSKKVAQQEQECIYTDKVPYALCQITRHSCTPTTTRDTHIFLLPFLFFNQAFLLFA